MKQSMKMRKPNVFGLSHLDGHLHEPCRARRAVWPSVQMTLTKPLKRGPLNGPLRAPRTVRGPVVKTLAKILEGATQRTPKRSVDACTGRLAYRAGDPWPAPEAKLKCNSTRP